MKCIPLLSCFFLTTLVTFRSCDAYPNKYKKNYVATEMKEYKYTEIPFGDHKDDRMAIAEIFFAEDLMEKGIDRHITPDITPKRSEKCPTPKLEVRTNGRCETPDLGSK
jgi:hypothetical protein